LEENIVVDFIHKFFHPQDGEEHEGKEKSVRHDLHVATCALLMEMAHIDGTFSKKERDAITELLKNEYHLSPDHIREITQTAEQELENSHDLWTFTNLINRNYPRAEKIRIIELIWEIIYSDGQLNQYEDYLVHKLARLLNLQHSELIDAKLAVLDKYRPNS
jgi:uncharacterized tellurite resistance protein B-like protein